VSVYPSFIAALGTVGRRSADVGQVEAQHFEGRQFATLQRAFAPTGGMVAAGHVEQLMRKHREQPISTLARWIVSRQVISFDWQAWTLLPLFQFDPLAMTVRPGVAAVVRELAGVFDGWDLASWFAHPNAWLDGRAPVDCLRADAESVIEAARADRFIAAG
jgi:hypothetical protein